MRRVFENRHGRVVTEDITDVIPIKGVRVANFDPADSFDLTKAEQVALITRDERIQLMFDPLNMLNRWMLLLHTDVSDVIVLRVVECEYNGPPASHMIALENSQSIP